MWFVKSIQSSESLQIYFDSFDNKHVRRGGTLAWRCNNPGLIRSHSNIALRYGSIGHCGQYPVFPNITLGRRALYSWLRLKSYYSEPLIAIAQYHSSEDPEQYLAELCHLSGLDPKCIPSQLSQKQFDKLAWPLKKLLVLTRHWVMKALCKHQKLLENSLIMAARSITISLLISELLPKNKLLQR